MLINLILLLYILRFNFNKEFIFILEIIAIDWVFKIVCIVLILSLINVLYLIWFLFFSNDQHVLEPLLNYRSVWGE